MRKAACLFLLITIFCEGFGISSVRPENLKYHAAIEGEIIPDKVNRIVIPVDIFTVSEREDLGDIRIYDSNRQEVPYVMYDYTRPERPTVTFDFEIKAYDKTDKYETILLKTPDTTRSFNQIGLMINGTDFKKKVIISRSDDNVKWSAVGEDMVYDFTSRINLRKDIIELKEKISAGYIRLQIYNDNQAVGEDKVQMINYGIINVSVQGGGGRHLNIQRITGILKEDQGKAVQYSSVELKTFLMRTDKQNITYIEMGNIKVPINRITLKAANRFYHRNVEIMISDDKRGRSFRRYHSADIFRFSGIGEKSDIDVSIPKGSSVRLVIRNYDNQQLKVNELKLSWIQKNIYFMPETGDKYVLYAGNGSIERPIYELGQLIKKETEGLFEIAPLSISASQVTEGFKSQISRTMKEKIEKMLFVSLIIAIVAGISYWIFSLIKKISL